MMANKLPMNRMQEKVRNFMTRHGLLHAPEIHVLDLLSEIGEVAKEVLKASRYGQQAPQLRPQLAEELGDVGYALFALACACQVDLEEALNQVLAKYEDRLATREDPGSGR
jgi:NTP pyrophosphatase (non-canonical NTP hydrolase)